MDVTGASADAYLYVSASSAASIGTLTVGGLDLSVNANVDAAVSEHATATVDLFNDGDIVIGDVSFNVGDAKGANPVTDANRSEEHTSEPQSLMRNSYDVFCLKKKK